MNTSAGKRVTPSRTMSSARRRMSFLPPASRCCRDPAARSRSPTARAATACGWREQGLDVTAIDFSPTAQKKARALAAERRSASNSSQTDVHAWDYPQAAFDVVVEIFAQFSTPAERLVKWAGMRARAQARRASDPAGLYAQAIRLRHRRAEADRESLYARAAGTGLRRFSRFDASPKRSANMHEGAAHSGMSAVIGLTARKP